MKALLAAILVSTLAACASTEYGGVKTPSPIYDAKKAGGRTQDQVNRCVAVGQAVFWKESTDIDGGWRNVKAGDAYESCIAKL